MLEVLVFSVQTKSSYKSMVATLLASTNESESTKMDWSRVEVGAVRLKSS